MGVGVKKRANPAPPESRSQSSTGRHKYQTETPPEPSEGDSARTKGATIIFSSIFIIKTSFILSISILPCLPGDINVAKD